MDNLISKIQSMNLTKTEKVIADYILDNINNIGLSTATDVSLKLGVSDTSIIRFIRLLGFAGFADFKNTMKERMLEPFYFIQVLLQKTVFYPLLPLNSP